MSLTEESIKTLNFKQLQKHLKAVGLKANGKKAVLAQRLIDHVKQQAPETEAQEAVDDTSTAEEQPVAAEEPAAEEEPAVEEKPAPEPAKSEPAPELKTVVEEDQCVEAPVEEAPVEEAPAPEPAKSAPAPAEESVAAVSNTPAEASTNTTNEVLESKTQNDVTPTPAPLITSAPSISAPLVPTPPAPKTDDSPLSQRKLFCGGLTMATSEAVLRGYLSKFGPLVEVVVIKDRTTQISRGYGFATFATKADTQKVLTKTVHNVGGKDITLKLADMPGHKSADTAKKIFIGGVNDSHTEDSIRQAFSQFGNIVSVALLKDQAGRSRGFGFLAYDASNAASAATARGTLEVGGVQITIKNATPRKTQFRPQFGRPAFQRPSYGYSQAAYGVAAAMRAQQMRQRQYGAASAYSQYGAATGATQKAYGATAGYGQQTAYGQTASGYGQQTSASGYGQQSYNPASSAYSRTTGYGAAQQSYGAYGKTSSGAYQTGTTRYSPY